MKSWVVPALAAAFVAACAPNAPAPARPLIVDDSQRGQGLEHFIYTGSWEHLRARNDGRFKGTSSRSHHARDSAVLPFVGSVIRIYGVRGPNGGDAAIGIDGRYLGTASFFAPQKQTHVLVFESPALPNTAHTFGLVVNGDPGGSHHAYVNLDDAEVLPQQ